MSAETMITTRGLRLTFTGRTGTVEAVKGIDLDVHKGEIFGFLGPNGAGKTTTLRMLATLLTPTAGTATVAGVDLLAEPEKVRERIGYVGQSGGTQREMPGRQELILQGRFYGMSKPDATRRADELLEIFRLSDAGRRKARTYSGGMKRRLDIAMGMVHRPPLLFLDEPTTGLDPQARAYMWDEIRAVRDRGTTIFLTTHYLEEADALCDRIAIIDHGLIVALDTPEAMKREIGGDVITIETGGEPAPVLALLSGQPRVREARDEAGAIRVYVEAGSAALPEIIRLLDGAGVPIKTIALARPSLNDVFLRQTGRSLRDNAAA